MDALQTLKYLQEGNFDITEVDRELVEQKPSATQMGKVYMRLILATMGQEEDYVDGLIRVYKFVRVSFYPKFEIE